MVQKTDHQATENYSPNGICSAELQNCFRPVILLLLPISPFLSFQFLPFGIEMSTLYLPHHCILKADKFSVFHGFTGKSLSQVGPHPEFTHAS